MKIKQHAIRYNHRYMFENVNEIFFQHCRFKISNNENRHDVIDDDIFECFIIFWYIVINRRINKKW